MRAALSAIVGGLCGLSLAFVVVIFTAPIYRARSVLTVAPPLISDRVVPLSPIATDSYIDLVSQNLLSRSMLIYIINTHGLFPTERKVMPVEDLVERMRNEHVHIASLAPGAETKGRAGFTIVFDYRDPQLAKKVAEDLTGRAMQETQRHRINLLMGTEQFIKDQLTVAAREWDDALAAIRRSPTPRAQTDVEMAKRHYETLKTRLQELRMEKEMYKRQLGSFLMIVESPALPQQAENRRAWLLPTGFLAGVLAVLGVRFGRRRIMQLAEAH